uniref:GEO12026p1 n=1 Tax=Drosophila melanogaster TaxID=7227 RepID=Q9VWM2_DROME|eukprot:NP_573348.1 uncharacterized protein Dmel_CG15882 [Drosophila melanogaster]
MENMNKELANMEKLSLKELLSEDTLSELATPNDVDIAGEEKNLEGQSVSKEDPPPAAVVPKATKAPNNPEALTQKQSMDYAARIVKVINLQMQNVVHKTFMMMQSPLPLRNRLPVVVSTMIRSRRAPKLKLKDVRRVITGLALHRAHLVYEYIINHPE